MKTQILNLIKQNNISIDKLQSLTNLNIDELESIIQELSDEHLIFLNTSNKYQAIGEEHLIGTLEKTSKGSCSSQWK